MKTYSAATGEIEPKWHIIDASNKVLGRLATEIAMTLRGKDKPTFTPNTDTGDFVIVINAEKVEMSGRKWETKNYYRHSGWFGGLKTTSAKEMREKNPSFIIEEAVQGMLPKNKLAKKLIQKLKVYAGPDHPHTAQRPTARTPKAPDLRK